MTYRRMMLTTLLALLAAVAAAQAQGPAPTKAITLAEGWRTVVLMHLEESRAYITGDVVEQMDPFLSAAAVRAVSENADQARLEAAGRGMKRLAVLMVRSGKRGPDGSVDVGPEAWETARSALCPLYPFCEP